MKILLLRSDVDGLGRTGDIVDVASGHARNFLLPQGKAKSASESNIAAFETEKAKLEDSILLALKYDNKIIVFLK